MAYDETLATTETLSVDVQTITIDETQFLVAYNGDGIIIVTPGPAEIMTPVDNVVGVGSPEEIDDAVLNIISGQITAIHQGNYAPIQPAPPFEPPIILPPAIIAPADPPKGTVNG